MVVKWNYLVKNNDLGNLEKPSRSNLRKKTDNYKPLKINQKLKFSHWNYGFQSRIFFILVGKYPFQVNSKDTELLYPLLQSLYQ